jgi:hypothetical protein
VCRILKFAHDSVIGFPPPPKKKMCGVVRVVFLLGAPAKQNRSREEKKTKVRPTHNE